MTGRKSIIMTFEEFQATKVTVDNVEEMQAVADSTSYGDVYNPETTTYLVYAEMYIIEYDSQTDVFYLRIGNMEYTDENLDRLELILYEFAEADLTDEEIEVPPEVLTQIKIIEELIRKEEAKTVLLTMLHGENSTDHVMCTATEEDITAFKEKILEKFIESIYENGYCSFTVQSIPAEGVQL